MTVLVIYKIIIKRLKLLPSNEASLLLLLLLFS